MKPTMWTISTTGYSQASSRRAWASGVEAAQAAASLMTLSAAP
ncbi:hypothetical protein [Massilia oculi]|nr:hypothetical protein [Massilia oculi]